MTAAKALPADLIDILLSDYKKSEDLIGENGLLKQLTKALVELALDAEMEAISVTPRTRRSTTLQATPATARVANRLRASSANCRSKYPV